MKAPLLVASLLLACQRPPRVVRRPGPALVEAGPGAVPDVVHRAQQEAQGEGRNLLVYVSATWCQPCEHFQKALRAGELDAQFPRLTLLKFDSDRDLDRLQAAGYDGVYIPRFVVPGADGRGTSRRMEGGTKAEDTVAASIAPRLRQLLGDKPLPGG